MAIKTRNARASTLIRLRARWRLRMWHIHPARILFVGAGLWIAAGWAVLSLPWVQAAPIGRLDTLIVAAAALSGAGLLPVDLPASLNLGGEAALLVLIQVGGLGHMTLGSLAYLAISDRLAPLRDRSIRAAFGLGSAMDLRLFLRSVLIFTLACQATGTLVLWALFDRAGVEAPLWQGLFHAVTAFCTAGISLLPDGFEPFRADPWVNAAVMTLALLGATGFLVVTDLWRRARGQAHEIGFSTVVILRVLPGLIGLGAVALAVAEPAIAGLPPAERALAALFQAVSATTTAGFNTVPIAGLVGPGAVVLMILMLIGSAPAGTGGGLKVTTFAALWALVGDVVAQRQTVAVFGRRISDERLRLAAASLCYYLGLAGLATFALSVTETGQPLGRIIFEVISALSTVGLSQGLTAEASDAGLVILLLLMVAGRVGLITFAIAIALPAGEERFREPGEDHLVL